MRLLFYFNFIFISTDSSLFLFLPVLTPLFSQFICIVLVVVRLKTHILSLKKYVTYVSKSNILQTIENYIQKNLQTQTIFTWYEAKDYFKKIVGFNLDVTTLIGIQNFLTNCRIYLILSITNKVSNFISILRCQNKIRIVLGIISNSL